MVYIWSEFAQKFRKFRNNPSSADVYQMVVFVESIAGLRPYEIVAAPGKPMKMQRSRVGFTMTMLHIMIFVMCSTYEFIYRPPTLSISNDPLNIYEEQILEYLQYINTIVFFVQVRNNICIIKCACIWIYILVLDFRISQSRPPTGSVEPTD